LSSAQKTLVCVATYNEIENLPRLVDAIETNLPAADLLVIDDCSPDGTGRWCDERAAVDSHLRCLHRQRKLGLGTAILAAMRYAIDHDYQYLVNMDADFSHPPERLPDLVGGMDRPGEQVDVMIGSRYIAGGGVEGWQLRRHFMSRGVNCYSRWLLGLTPKDVSGGYRCYRMALLRRLDFDFVAARGYAFQEEILWRLKRLGARSGETPFVFIDRRAGKSKINVKEMVSALWLIFVLGVRNWTSRA
jgi:dolichol-phosphate mannosyltransferase